MKTLLAILIVLLCAVWSSAQSEQPKSALDYFRLLPAKYFGIECCNGDKNAYIERYVDVETALDDYLESAGSDGAQGNFKMVLFKRSDGSRVIGLNRSGVVWDDYYFLEYKKGRWINVARKLVPDYSKKKIYEFSPDASPNCCF